MKLPVLFFCFCLFSFCRQLTAQMAKETRIKTADEVREVLSEKGIYRFPEFQNGTVFFKEGGSVPAKLNYNIWLEEMHFIDEKADTLSIADPALIKYIVIGQNLFYFEKSYLEVIEKYNTVTLAVKQVLQSEEQRKGAFGRPTLTNSVQGYDMYSADGQTYKLGRNEDLLITSKVYYFFGDEYNHFTIASREYILHKFPTHANAIEEFLKANGTKFNREADLEKLLEFCKQWE
jgi:hypothetical protein